ncbi:MAG: transcriptional regulator [Chitinophagales bacterium]
MKEIINQLEKAFESRIRLGIMSALMVNEQLDFNTLKELLDVSDGNLASHIKALEKLEYVEVRKKFIDRKPNTSYFATLKGQEAFENHLNALEKLLNRN